MPSTFGFLFCSLFSVPPPNHAYSSQLTELYGADIASDIVDRARSTTSLLGNTTTHTLLGSPSPDKDSFPFKSGSHTGQSLHRAF